MVPSDSHRTRRRTQRCIFRRPGQRQLPDWVPIGWTWKGREVSFEVSLKGMSSNTDMFGGVFESGRMSKRHLFGRHFKDQDLSYLLASSPRFHHGRRGCWTHGGVR